MYHNSMPDPIEDGLVSNVLISNTPSRPDKAYSPSRISHDTLYLNTTNDNSNENNDDDDDNNDNNDNNSSHARYSMSSAAVPSGGRTIIDGLHGALGSSNINPTQLSQFTRIMPPDNVYREKPIVYTECDEYNDDLDNSYDYNNYDYNDSVRSDDDNYNYNGRQASKNNLIGSNTNNFLNNKPQLDLSIPSPSFDKWTHKNSHSNSVSTFTSSATLVGDHLYEGKEKPDDEANNLDGHYGNDNKTYSGDYDDDNDSDYKIDETPLTYLSPPESQPRRNKETVKKQLKLVQGNLVIDCPVPTKLLSYSPRKDSDEFTHMRYSAITCDADDFGSSGFTLRSVLGGRETELCICVTMYNEDSISLCTTLLSIMNNVAYLNSRRKSRIWGERGWQKIVVCVIADGRSHVNPRVLDCLALMGLYQPGVAKNKVNGKAVTAHMYEYTTQMCIDPKMNYQGAETGLVPVQMVLLLKEKNTRKINSHRWLFNGFCPQLNPNICILLDVGTRPSGGSLYQLWKAFDENSNVGGACGEIKVMKGTHWKQLLANPLVAAQNFEYKISNILDKPFESIFGYITVLPGALSAYRYQAIKNHADDGTGPLNSYFKCETYAETINNSDDQRNPIIKPAKPSAAHNIFEKNMYLAEDRILCWELVAKRGEKWVLKYVKSATGETDVPTTISEFISQRRRWLNGAFFAAVYSQMHVKQLTRTNHSYARKTLLFIEFFYQFITLAFQFLSLANFYIAVYYISGSVQSPAWEAFFYIVQYLCLMVIGGQFVISLGNRPQGARYLFLTSMIVFAVITTYATICALYFAFSELFNGGQGQGDTPSNKPLLGLIISLISTYGLYFLISILYLDPWHLITSGIQYFLFLPGYLCTLQIHAFCNVDDITWGTKGNDTMAPDLGVASAVIQGSENSKINMVEVEIPAGQSDINYDYDESLAKLRQSALDIGHSGSASFTIVEGSQDHYRMIRSRLVLGWMGVNYLLVYIITNVVERTSNDNGYLTLIMWLVAFLGSLRLVGSLSYLGLRLVERGYKAWIKLQYRRKNYQKQYLNL